MTPTTFDAPDSNPALYLPHHPVFKDSSTTRLRVVFNASMIVTAKILMQELWIASLDWDDELQSDVSEKWNDYCRRLPELEAISISRWNHLTSRETECELHGFADASTRAYAAVVYLRTVTSEGEFKCTTYAWTDSSVVLAWLKQHLSEWPTFVANRVATVHRLQDVSWRHVPSAQNPADCASRGLTATELCTHPLWWQGPSWLKSSEAKWPRTPPTPPKSKLVEASQVSVKTHVAVDTILHWELYTEISTWNRLVRVTAYCMRFVGRCQRRNNATELRLSGDEIRNAQVFWINNIQHQHFNNEIQAIRKGKLLPRNSPLRNLTPFVDGKGTLRVGGRLEQANLPFEEKHPAILPKHRVSTLIVEDAHLRCLHGGHRPLVRNIINKCVPCVRERAKVPSQLMGNLPAARSTQYRAFLHTGLDYAGPFLVKTSKGRGHKSHKAYLALFVCTSTRAIHLELVSHYSSDAFLAAYRRFIARRGLPSDVYSDNGTTFQGAEKELQAAFKNAVNDPNLGNLIATDSTNWHFIPPGAPHIMGSWREMRKTSSETSFWCPHAHVREIQHPHYSGGGVIELAANWAEPNGPMRVRSTHTRTFPRRSSINQRTRTVVPSPKRKSSLEVEIGTANARKLLETLVHRVLPLATGPNKMEKTQQNIAVGNIVLIRNNLAPPNKWMLGRIVETHPGQDSRVRVVTVRTAKTQLKRPITQICLLPVDAADSDVTPTSPPDTPISSDSPDFQDCEPVETSSTTTVAPSYDYMYQSTPITAGGVTRLPLHLEQRILDLPVEAGGMFTPQSVIIIIVHGVPPSDTTNTSSELMDSLELKKREPPPYILNLTDKLSVSTKF
ncbi:uncharacterized protein LOC112451591 [Temnothorax curvispinosus]|uniref:Uncharacterized protein LOC112451591 n=1 Tax=Temnothorax curvispinosus TaxID=300111 RepID=A0A6J1PCQ5_9HYME|nr:uncharacterized protein LOC112451591 [Temnothorax curvispinosus]